MTDVAATLTWAAFGVAGYVYVGYPALLWLLSRVRSREVKMADISPTVTLVISAFNEAPAMAAKLRNSLALDYPHGLLQILVVSDASTDGTDEVARSFEAEGVQLLRLAKRRGKTEGLNAAMRVVAGEIVVFSDANILYALDAIRCLVRCFADPTVGCVTGDSRYTDPTPTAAHVQENAYWGYERMVRSLESRIGSTVGGDGAIFGIRRALYAPLPADAINDFVTPLQVVARGYRAVFEPRAVGFEPSAGDFWAEFRRKRRIVTRSWRGAWSVPGVLNPLRTGFFAWQLWSHKVLRWLVLPTLLLGVGASVMAASSGLLYRVVAWGFVASLAAALFGLLLSGRRGGLARLAHWALYFYLVNGAAVLGVLRAMAGRVDVVWASQRR